MSQPPSMTYPGSQATPQLQNSIEQLRPDPHRAHSIKKLQEESKLQPPTAGINYKISNSFPNTNQQ